MLEAGNIVVELAESPNGDSDAAGSLPQTEAVARELVPLRPDPAEMREAWAAVTARNPRPTAREVRAEVKARLAPPVALVVARLEPPAHPGDDIRFSRIENAADSLKTLPAWSKLAWPVEAGDIEAMDEALEWLYAEIPNARRVWKAHKARLRAPKRAAAQRIVAAAVPAAMGNGTRP